MLKRGLLGESRSDKYCSLEYSAIIHPQGVGSSQIKLKWAQARAQRPELKVGLAQQQELLKTGSLCRSFTSKLGPWQNCYLLQIVYKLH